MQVVRVDKFCGSARRRRRSACWRADRHVLATGASMVLSRLMQLPYSFNPTVNVFSFLFLAGIGVLFGYFPARRTARMDPIEALRHEWRQKPNAWTRPNLQRLWCRF